MLNNLPILIVEDEVFIALDLALSIEDRGGVVIGPASTLEEAIALVASNDICGAILDVHLPDGDVGPLLPALIARQVAIVVQTGGGLPQHLQDAYPDLLVLRKPNAANMLVQTLERSLAA